MKKLSTVLLLFAYVVLLKFSFEIWSDGYILFKNYFYQKHLKIAESQNPVQSKKEAPIQNNELNAPVQSEVVMPAEPKIAPPALSEVILPIQKEGDAPAQSEVPSSLSEPISSVQEKINPPIQNEVKPVVDSESLPSPDKTVAPVEIEVKTAVQNLPIMPIQKEANLPAQIEANAPIQIESTPVIQSDAAPLTQKEEASPPSQIREIAPVQIEPNRVVQSATTPPIQRELESPIENATNRPIESEKSAINQPESPIIGQKEPYTPIPSSSHPTQNSSFDADFDRWDSFCLPKFLSIRHVWGDQEAECVPFATNYTTLEMLFAPHYVMGKIMPMVDLRGHRFDDNTYAANAGLGGRYIPNPDYDYLTEILGFNAYYDYRQGYIGYYNQLGAGVEILSKRWDFRANAYVPFGPKCHVDTTIYTCYTTDYYLIRRSIESISYSFNAEIGCLLLDIGNTFSLYAAGGPYFIARAIRNGGVVGGEARLKPKYKDFMALDLSWRYDDLFGTIWQVEVILNIPLYQIRGKNKSLSYIKNWQIYQPIDRFEVMPLSLQNCWRSNF